MDPLILVSLTWAFFVYGVWDIICALGGADWIRYFVSSLQGLSRAVAMPVRPPPRLEGFY